MSLSFLAVETLSRSALAGWPVRPGGFPGLAPIDLTKPPENLDDSLNVIASYLVGYAPPNGEFPIGGWKATYDLIEWVGSASGDGDKFSRRNRVIGRQVVTRHPLPAGSGVEYRLDHTIAINGFETTLRSTMHCSSGRLPGLTDWETDYEMHPTKRGRSSMKLNERGRCREGSVEIASSAGVRTFQTDRPVAPQWAVMDALRGAPGAASDPGVDGEFDLMHDLTSYRPRQRLTACGVLEVSLDGRSHTLHGFVQTGFGTQPTHYWIDSKGRPLICTGGLISSALTALRAL